MKKNLAIILALVMVVSLTSCATTGKLMDSNLTKQPVENEQVMTDADWKTAKFILNIMLGIATGVGSFALWNHIR